MLREQLKVVRMRYPNMSDSLNYSNPPRNWNTITRAEKFFPEVGMCVDGPNLLLN